MYGDNEAAKWLSIVTGIASVILMTALVMTAIYYSYQMDKDIGGWIHRAQVASNPGDMHGYLTNAITGIEKWGVTEGHCAMTLRTPANDLGLIFKSLMRMQERASILMELDATSDAYQNGLDDLRGTLREWGPPGYYCVIALRQQVVFWLWLVVLGLLVTFFVSGMHSI